MYLYIVVNWHILLLSTFRSEAIYRGSEACCPSNILHIIRQLQLSCMHIVWLFCDECFYDILKQLQIFFLATV